MRSFQTKLSVNKTNVLDGLFKPVTQQNLPENRKQAEIHSNVLKPGMYRIVTTTTQNREPQLPHASRNTNPHVSKSSEVNHTTSVSRPQLKCYQVKDKLGHVGKTYVITVENISALTPGLLGCHFFFYVHGGVISENFVLHYLTCPWGRRICEKNYARLRRLHKEDLIKKIKDFDDNIANETGDVMVDSQRSTWLENLRSIQLKENLDLSQKAKIKWGVEADENSKFFHAIVKRYLSIHEIKYEEHWLTDPLTIKDALFTFYETKFQRVDVVKIASRSPFYKSLNEDQNSYLVSLITESEIKDAIWDRGSEKSPGPDGITFAFYKKL
ncbi:hypothetical protein Tco_1062892 [Tanacetum coccineum]